MSDEAPLRVHLYVAVLEEIDDEPVRARCESWLCAEERERQTRFIFEENRREFLYAHALKRWALSQHSAGIAPRAWQFSATSHGRPFATGPPEAPALHFNLSHTDGLVACVVAHEPLVGVDVEAANRGRATMDIAERFFAPSEIQALQRLPDHAQLDLFFRYWTLKESYVKARGLGLTIPLDAFWFTFDQGIEVNVVVGRGFTESPVRWRFVEVRPTLRHRLAVAVGIPSTRDSSVELVQHGFEPGVVPAGVENLKDLGRKGREGEPAKRTVAGDQDDSPMRSDRSHRWRHKLS